LTLQGERRDESADNIKQIQTPYCLAHSTCRYTLAYIRN